ncbi:MAG: RNA polymerase sigma-70 factor [Chitinophagaceae bacterium]|nr:MAG: RNA polymerase sigma-70 factor [Chitinophagaceae bacterium]
MSADLLSVPGDLAHSDVVDDALFEELFHLHFAPLCAWCEIKFGFPAETARDTVQSAYLKFWEARHSLSAKDAAKAYLYKIVGNTSLDLIKHQKVKAKKEKHLLQTGEPLLLQDGYESIDFKELHTSVNDAIAELPDQMKKIFILCKMEGLKYNDAATHLNVSVKTIETQMSRALSKLRVKLAKYMAVCIVIITGFTSGKNNF